MFVNFERQGCDFLEWDGKEDKRWSQNIFASFQSNTDPDILTHHWSTLNLSQIIVNCVEPVHPSRNIKLTVHLVNTIVVTLNSILWFLISCETVFPLITSNRRCHTTSLKPYKWQFTTWNIFVIWIYYWKAQKIETHLFRTGLFLCLNDFHTWSAYNIMNHHSSCK